MNRINVGLIGYGMAARVFHAPVMQSIPQLELTKRQFKATQKNAQFNSLLKHDAELLA